MDNVCVVNMWSVCLLGVWGCKERVECVECVECVFGVHECFRLAHDGSVTHPRARSTVPNLIMETSVQEQGT